MDPQTQFCHNLDCPASGQVGKGNIVVHSRKEGRCKCNVCGKTFSETKGTVFYRLRTAKDVVVLIVTLLAHGCPLQAVCIAFSLDERTVLDWQARGVGNTASKCTNTWESSRATWDRCKPTRYGSRCKAACCGWRWPSKSRHACGWAVCSVPLGI